MRKARRGIHKCINTPAQDPSMFYSKPSKTSRETVLDFLVRRFPYHTPPKWQVWLASRRVLDRCGWPLSSSRTSHPTAPGEAFKSSSVSSVILSIQLKVFGSLH